MNEFKMFRYLNQIEKEIIKNSFTTISSNLVSNFGDFEKNLYVFIKKQTKYNNFPKIYLLSVQLKKLLENVCIHGNISLAGLYFGFIKRGEFYLSIEGADVLYKRGLISDIIKLYVNKRGEKSILYGNNILKNMLITKSYNFKEKDIALVFNEDEEIIAISRIIVEGNQVQMLKPEDFIAITLSDKGIYLREKQ